MVILLGVGLLLALALVLVAIVYYYRQENTEVDDNELKKPKADFSVDGSTSNTEGFTPFNTEVGTKFNFPLFKTLNMVIKVTITNNDKIDYDTVDAIRISFNRKIDMGSEEPIYIIAYKKDGLPVDFTIEIDKDGIVTPLDVNINIYTEVNNFNIFSIFIKDIPDEGLQLPDVFEEPVKDMKGIEMYDTVTYALTHNYKSSDPYKEGDIVNENEVKIYTKEKGNVIQTTDMKSSMGEDGGVRFSLSSVKGGSKIDVKWGEMPNKAIVADTATAVDTAADTATAADVWKLSENLEKVWFICNTTVAQLNGSPIDITDVFRETLEEVEYTDEIQASDAERYICNQAEIINTDLVAEYTNFACLNGGSYPGSRKFFNDLDKLIYEKYNEDDNNPPAHAKLMLNNPCAASAEKGMFHGYWIRYKDANKKMKNAFVKWGAYIDLSENFNGNDDKGVPYAWVEALKDESNNI